jgi:ribosomal protein L24E
MNILKLGLISVLASGVMLAKDITVNAPGHFPEGVEYNTKTGDFFLGSLSKKGIIKFSKDGKATQFSSSAPLQIAGIHIDYAKNKLYAAGLNRKEAFDKDPNTHGNANLFIYDLSSGELEKNIDLTSVNPNQQAYFANDITNDDNGNVYVSDFKAGAVYKIDSNHKVSLFYKGDMLGLANGLEVVNNKFILVSDIIPRDGKWQLVKIPLDNPSKTTRIMMGDDIYRGFDGMLVNSDGTIVGVTHNKKKSASHLIKLSSDDMWKSAKVVGKTSSKTRLTTVARIKDGEYYGLQQNFKNPKKVNWILEDKKLP